ncbi:hypothetical protein HanIR_Chr02g0094931 [Helianthus annuus]|nr:hypothetical protein HanIR_Chr02g0094931 [Helianthus annuus]
MMSSLSINIVWVQILYCSIAAFFSALSFSKAFLLFSTSVGSENSCPNFFSSLPRKS